MLFLCFALWHLKRPQNWSWRYRVVPSLWLWRVTSPGRVLLCQSSGVASLGHRVNLVISGWRNWHRFHRAGQGRSHNVLSPKGSSFHTFFNRPLLNNCENTWYFFMYLARFTSKSGADWYRDVTKIWLRKKTLVIRKLLSPRGPGVGLTGR